MARKSMLDIRAIGKMTRDKIAVDKMTVKNYSIK